MAFGTDVVIDLPGMNRVQSNLKILNNWKAAGIPSSYIMQTMTMNAAELLGLDKQRGFWRNLIMQILLRLSVIHWMILKQLRRLSL